MKHLSVVPPLGRLLIGGWSSSIQPYSRVLIENPLACEASWKDGFDEPPTIQSVILA